MKLSKKYTAYATILGLAVTAYGIDCAFFGPKPAEAVAVAADEPVGVSASDTVAPAAEPHIAPAPGVADQLRTLSGNGNIELPKLRNAFSPSSKWIAEKQPEAALPREQFAESFRHAHRVVAIMTDKKGARAIVDDRLLRVGQSIDGFQLTSVDHRSACFSGHGVQVILSVGENLIMADSN